MQFEKMEMINIQWAANSQADTLVGLVASPNITIGNDHAQFKIDLIMTRESLLQRPYKMEDCSKSQPRELK